MSVKIYTAVITTAFDRFAEVELCASFSKEIDAVQTVMMRIIEAELIHREHYLEFIRNAKDDGHDDNGLVEKIEKMSDIDFVRMIIKKVDENPTIIHLEKICLEYSDTYGHQWTFQIKICEIASL